MALHSDSLEMYLHLIFSGLQWNSQQSFTVAFIFIHFGVSAFSLLYTLQVGCGTALPYSMLGT